MLAFSKRVVDYSIIYLSATQLMHAPAHATVQQLLCKILNFMSTDLWSQQARAELN